MKKFAAMIVALMMLFTTAFACDCVTDSVRIALFDLTTMEDIMMTSEEHDTLVSAYLGLGESCSEVKAVVMTILMENYSVISEKMTSEKIAVLTEYVVTCGCGCGEVKADPTDEPTVTPAPTTVTHKHSGGTHQNGGVCQVCGKKYQKHTWRSWSYTSNSAPHTRVCSCGYKESGSHKFVAIEEHSGYTLKRCTVCGLEYRASKSGGSSSDCGCGCSYCKQNNCNGCECGCGNHG